MMVIDLDNENVVSKGSYSTPLVRLMSHERKRPSMERVHRTLALQGAEATSQPFRFSNTEFYAWTKVLNVLSWSSDDHLVGG